jgi:ubiquinone biosynthesis monooxygenase Coq7
MPKPDTVEPKFRAPCIAVFFDGSCPLCVTEIAMYRKLPARSGIVWTDVSNPDYCPPLGMSRAELMRRFHVINLDGELLSGARAFVHVWSQLPGWQHLAQLSRVPGLLAIMDIGYQMFLVVRPAIQRIYRLWLQRAQHQTRF